MKYGILTMLLSTLVVTGPCWANSVGHYTENESVNERIQDKLDEVAYAFRSAWAVNPNENPYHVTEEMKTHYKQVMLQVCQDKMASLLKQSGSKLSLNQHLEVEAQDSDVNLKMPLTTANDISIIYNKSTRYLAKFAVKISDCIAECSETEVGVGDLKKKLVKDCHAKPKIEIVGGVNLTSLGEVNDFVRITDWQP